MEKNLVNQKAVPNHDAPNAGTDVLGKIVIRLLNELGKLPVHTALEVGKGLGRLWMTLIPSRRRLAERNVAASFPEITDPEFPARIARGSFECSGRTILEICRIFRMSPSEIRNLYELEGLENYLKVRRENRGVLILTGHIGNWELLALAVSLEIAPGFAIARPLDFKPLDVFMTQVRTRGGNKVLPKDGSMRPVMKALKAGASVGVLLDQNTSHREGVFVDFFGRRACTNRALGFLAMTADAAVIPAYDVRLPSGKHRITFLPELELVRSGDRTRDIEDNTALFTRTLEEMIREHPDQWLWFHNRWSQKPWTPWPRREDPPRGPRRFRAWFRKGTP